MQNRPYVTSFKIDHFVGSGRSETTAKIEIRLPFSTDPSELLAKLKGDELWSGVSAGAVPDSTTAALRHQLEQARQAAKDSEERANEIARSLVAREIEIVQLKATSHPDTEALLALRKRMHVTLQATEDADLARELYERVVREWGNTLVEGMSFTQAEGDDLVERLVQIVQYLDLSRATLKAEKKSAVKPTRKKKDQLF